MADPNQADGSWDQTHPGLNTMPDPNIYTEATPSLSTASNPTASNPEETSLFTSSFNDASMTRGFPTTDPTTSSFTPFNSDAGMSSTTAETASQTPTATATNTSSASPNHGGSGGGGGGGGGGIPTSTKVAIAVPVSIVGAALVFAILFFILRRRRRQKGASAPDPDTRQLNMAASSRAAPMSASALASASASAQRQTGFTASNNQQAPSAPGSGSGPHDIIAFAGPYPNQSAREDALNAPRTQTQDHVHDRSFTPPASAGLHSSRDALVAFSPIDETEEDAGRGHRSQDDHDRDGEGDREPVSALSEHNPWNSPRGDRPQSPFDHPDDLDTLSVVSEVSERRGVGLGLGRSHGNSHFREHFGDHGLVRTRDMDEVSSVSSFGEDERERGRGRDQGSV